MLMHERFMNPDHDSSGRLLHRVSVDDITSRVQHVQEERHEDDEDEHLAEELPTERHALLVRQLRGRALRLRATMQCRHDDLRQDRFRLT